MKKTIKLFFCGKDDTQISRVTVVKKAPSPWKKNFSKKKKNLPAYLCGYDLQNGVRKYFLNKCLSRYLSFGDFTVPKNCSSQ